MRTKIAKRHRMVAAIQLLIMALRRSIQISNSAFGMRLDATTFIAVDQRLAIADE